MPTHLPNLTRFTHYFHPSMLAWFFLYIAARLIIAFILRATRRKRHGEYE